MQNLNETGFEDEFRKQINAAAKTAGIAAAISLAASIVGAIAFMINPKLPAVAVEGFTNETAQLAKVSGIFSVLVSLAVSGLIFYFLYKFSSLALKAFRKNDQQLLTRSFINLASYFKIWGIIILLVLVFSFFSILAGGAGAAMG